MKQGGTAGKEENHPVLDRIFLFCQGRDFLIHRKIRSMNKKMLRKILSCNKNQEKDRGKRNNKRQKKKIQIKR